MATRRKPKVSAPPEKALASAKAGDGALRLREMSVEELVRRLRRDEAADKRFALFLGAGCSVTSGIPLNGQEEGVSAA